MKILSPIRNCPSTAKRLALSVTIAGSLFASGLAPSLAFAKRVDPALSGGISILVHRFDEDAAPIDPTPVVIDEVKTEADSDTPDLSEENERSEEAEASDEPTSQKIIAIPGTHDSIPTVAVDAQPKADLPSVDLPNISPSSEDEIEADSGDLQLAAAELDVAPSTSVRRTSSDFNEMLAAVAASTAAKIGIPLEQFLEPFAMIRTKAILPPVAGELDPAVEAKVADDEALAQAVALNRWWLDESKPEVTTDEPVLQSQVVQKAVKPSPAPHKFTIDVREELAALAAEEPMDLSPSAVILPFIAKHDFSEPIAEAEVEMEVAVEPEVIEASTDELAGSSPVIVTLEEAYLPYDLNEGDVHEAQVVKSSPDCLLDEAVWQAEQLAVAAKRFSPRELGGLLADVSRRRSIIEADVLNVVADDLASMVATPVAMMLVDGEPVPQPVPDAEPDTVHSIDTMVVDGDVIPAPTPDSVPDELPNSAVIEIMLVDGDLVPAPTPDTAPDAVEPAPMTPTMLVDGDAIPAPTPDGIPNGIVSLDTATGIESIVAVDVVPESAYPKMNPGLDPASLEAETQLATRPEDENVQR
ncbi:hypothetical protein [Rhodopirellula bahusiensis]|uniref:hypothetical protein n=1 Tax=Rhodopirellula bahusiensis TaxID=2014065 RepID=UPI0032669ABE